MMKKTFTRLALALSLSAASLGAFAQGVLRVSAIPDEAPTELQRKFTPLGDYLKKETGMDVQFTPVTDYAAVVEGLATAKTLADLKGKTFAFGAPSSTSGSLMPRYFLLQAGINPEKDFKTVAFSGAHDATVAFVAASRAEAGVLNASVWDKLVEAKNPNAAKVRVLATTPTYYDYNWTVRPGLDPALTRKLADAFLKLDPANPAHKEIMALQRASKFIPTKSSNYDGIETAGKSAGLIK